jgi:polar amino acid transport system substrate-binding protein
MGRWLSGLLLLLTGPLFAADWHLVTQNFPPFSYPQGGGVVAANAPVANAAGPFAEIIQLACQRLGHHCSLQVLPWRRALELAETGKVDGIFAVLGVPERQRYFHVSHMLVATRYSFFTLPGQTFNYRQPADLKGVHIGVYGPSGTSLALESLLKMAGGGTLEMETDNPRVLRKLLAGRYGNQGVVLMNDDVQRYLQRQLGLPVLREAGTAQVIAYGVGLSRARISEADFKAFNNVLAELQLAGSVAEILRRYQLQAAP